LSRLRYHEAAELELLQEIAYLESQRPGLGRRFLSEVVQLEEQILEHPDAGAPLRPEIRKRILPVAHVSRLTPADSTRTLRRVSLATGAGGQPMDRSDTVSVTTVVALTGTVPWARDASLGVPARDGDDVRAGMPRGDEFTLAPGDRAGGTRPEADKGRTSVSYPNGSRATPGRFLFWRDYPDVEPGSVIVVPVAPDAEGFDWDQFLTRTLSVTSTIITLILALDRL